jgi:perosamine synthetase
MSRPKSKGSGFRIDWSPRGHIYTPEEIALVADVMQNAPTLTQGEYRDSFEKAYSSYLGVEHSFAVNNATSALELAAQLCNFHPGDEIIAPAHTFTSSVYPFLKKGARPVWADIDPITRVITTDLIAKCISPKTKAILVVHLYGYMADMPGIAALAAEKGLILIEDNAQSLGASIKGRKAGSFSDFSITSFHSHKNISTLGEGGMLSVRDSGLAELVKMLRHNGHCSFNFEQEKYWLPAMGNLDLPQAEDHYLWPNNYCLGEVECALGTALLGRLDYMNAERKHRAIAFIDALKDYPEAVFHRDDSPRHVYHQLVACFPGGQRDSFIQMMAGEKGIKCITPYYPLNRYPFYQRLGFGKADIPNTDAFFDNMASLPFHHWMPEEDFQYMIQATRECLAELRAN